MRLGPPHVAPFHYQASVCDVWGQSLSRWPRTSQDTSAQSLAVICFSEETKWLRWATYVALGNGREQYTEVTSHHSSLINIHVKINGWDLLALELLRALFKPFNSYALPTVPLLHLREPSLSISTKNALFSLYKNSKPSNLHIQRYDFYSLITSLFMILMLVTCL